MWLRRFSDYILKHRYRALALTFLITFVPILGTLGILIAAFMTLVKGAVEGALFSLAAIVPYIISFYVTGNQPSETAPLVLWAAVGVAVISNTLTWVFAVMLRRQSSWSTILQVAALLGVLVISIVHLAYPDVQTWWAEQLQTYYTKAAEATGAATNNATPSVQNQVEAISVSKQYATGLMTAAVLFNALLQLGVARWWQALVFRPGFLRRELHNIRLGHLAGILFVASLVLAYLGNSVVLDIMPVLYMLFAAAGLSLIHYLFGLKKSSTTWFWLAIVYLTLIFSLPQSVFLVAVLALLDIWLNVRKRLQTV